MAARALATSSSNDNDSVTASHITKINQLKQLLKCLVGLLGKGSSILLHQPGVGTPLVHRDQGH